MDLTLRLLEGNLAVARLKNDAALPAWLDMNSKPLVCAMRTSDELSIVCPEEVVPSNVLSEKGWRAFRIVGTIDFALTGVLASVLNPLAEAKVGIFALSTFDTDYILVRAEKLGQARAVLEKQFRIEDR